MQCKGDLFCPRAVCLGRIRRAHRRRLGTATWPSIRTSIVPVRGTAGPHLPSSSCALPRTPVLHHRSFPSAGGSCRALPPSCRPCRSPRSRSS